MVYFDKCYILKFDIYNGVCLRVLKYECVIDEKIINVVEMRFWVKEFINYLKKKVVYVVLFYIKF